MIIRTSTRFRRLVRIYERKPEHHEALIWWATVHQMTRRLARELAGQPPPGRWGDPQALPALSSPDRRGKVLELLAAQPWRAWKGAELAAILGIEISNAWNAVVSQSGTQVTARNMSYNGSIAAGGSTSFGFQASYSGNNTAPARFILNGTDCTEA